MSCFRKLRTFRQISLPIPSSSTFSASASTCSMSKSRSGIHAAAALPHPRSTSRPAVVADPPAALVALPLRLEDDPVESVLDDVDRLARLRACPRRRARRPFPRPTSGRSRRRTRPGAARPPSRARVASLLAGCAARSSPRSTVGQLPRAGAQQPRFERRRKLRFPIDENRDLVAPATPERVLQLGRGLDAKRRAELAFEPPDSVRRSAAFADLDHCCSPLLGS